MLTKLHVDVSSDRHWVSDPPSSQIDDETVLPLLDFVRTHCLPPCSLISETHPGAFLNANNDARVNQFVKSSLVGSRARPHVRELLRRVQ